MTMLKPMPRFPMRQSAPLQRSALPHDLLLVDIRDATLLGEGASAQGRQLFCSLQLLESGAGSKPAVRTRTLAADASGGVPWNERMVLSLPLSADAQSLGVEVWDAAANGGRGSLVASGAVAVPVKDLLNREEHAADLELKSSSGQAAVQLHATYMLQNQWAELLATPGDSWSAEQSTSGQRALSISSNPGVWVVIPPFGQQKAASSAAARNAGAGERHGHLREMHEYSIAELMIDFWVLSCCSVHRLARPSEGGQRGAGGGGDAGGWCAARAPALAVPGRQLHRLCAGGVPGDGGGRRLADGGVEGRCAAVCGAAAACWEGSGSGSPAS